MEHVAQHAEKGNPIDVLKKIDEFCSKIWMMHMGDEKANIIW